MNVCKELLQREREREVIRGEGEDGRERERESAWWRDERKGEREE